MGLHGPSNCEGAKKFNHYPHLALVVGRDEISAQMAIPNSLRGSPKNRLTSLEENEFMELLSLTEENLRPVVATYRARPIARCLHRHYRGQKVSTIDATLEFDLRTLPLTRATSPVKQCDAWWQAALAGLKAPGINYEIGIGTKLEHVDDGPFWGAAAAIDFVERSWLACKSIVELLTT